MKKNGKRKGVQRYKCRTCGSQFQSKRRKQKALKRLWNEYVWGKQNLTQLGKRYNRNPKWVRRHLDKIEIKEEKIVPQQIVIIADTTFWGRHYGVCVFRSPLLKKNLWWIEVSSERMAHYSFGRKTLEDQGWVIVGAVVDGRRGLTTVFNDIPTQICQFHQIKRITKYLTRKPKTKAGKELSVVARQLTKGNEKEFTELLFRWHEEWEKYIKERTLLPDNKHWYYTHGKVRSAYLSLKRNLPYLFTCQKYPKLEIPNTTNSLDGMFTQLKAKINVHRGLRQDRRFKLISEILKGEEK